MNPNTNTNPRLMEGNEIAKEIVAIVSDENKITLSQLSRAKTLYDELYYREAMQSRIPTRFDLNLFEIVVFSTMIQVIRETNTDNDPSSIELFRKIDNGVKQSLDKDGKRITKGLAKCMKAAYAVGMERGYVLTLSDLNGDNEKMTKLMQSMLPEYLSSKDIETMKKGGSDIFRNITNQN